VTFPTCALMRAGSPGFATIENDGRADSLHLARVNGGKMEPVAAVSSPGVLHHPALARDGAGGMWCIWGQVDDRDVMTLRAPTLCPAKGSKTKSLSRSRMGATLSRMPARTRRATCGSHGSRCAAARRMCLVRWFDAAKREWSKEIAISPHEGGKLGAAARVR